MKGLLSTTLLTLPAPLQTAYTTPSPIGFQRALGPLLDALALPKAPPTPHTNEQQNRWDELPCCLMAEVWDGFSCHNPTAELRKGFLTFTISHPHHPPSPSANAKAQGAFISLLGTERGCLVGKGAVLFPALLQLMKPHCRLQLCVDRSNLYFTFGSAWAGKY